VKGLGPGSRRAASWHGGSQFYGRFRGGRDRIPPVENPEVFRGRRLRCFELPAAFLRPEKWAARPIRGGKGWGTISEGRAFCLLGGNILFRSKKKRRAKKRIGKSDSSRHHPIRRGSRQRGSENGGAPGGRSAHCDGAPNRTCRSGVVSTTGRKGSGRRSGFGPRGAGFHFRITGAAGGQGWPPPFAGERVAKRGLHGDRSAGRTGPGGKKQNGTPGPGGILTPKGFVGPVENVVRRAPFRRTRGKNLAQVQSQIPGVKQRKKSWKKA